MLARSHDRFSRPAVDVQVCLLLNRDLGNKSTIMDHGVVRVV